jgi:ATP-binding cassette subfamily C (CFTR/MRP) protein 1
MATFLVFSIIAILKSDRTLLSAQAFTSLSLISLLTKPLMTFIQAVPNVYQCLGCFERIGHFCSLESHETQPNLDPSSQSSGSDREVNSKKACSSLAEMKSASFAWNEKAEPVLHDVSLKLFLNKITLVVGPVSSGKSTFLGSILGETVMTSGSLTRYFSQAAYCSQPPWIMNASILMNVTNTLGAVDKKWYQFSKWACALDSDIDSLPGKDLFKAGSDGVALSGGQKQRIVSLSSWIESMILIQTDKTIGFGSIRVLQAACCCV